MKPQLAKDAPLNADGTLKVDFPVAVQPKYDGIRCCIVDGKALTRSLKEVPNREIFATLSRPEFEGLDGEIIVGDPTAEGCFGRTTSYVMTSTKKIGGDWGYYVFDRWNQTAPFRFRMRDVQRDAWHLKVLDDRVRVADVIYVRNLEELIEVEAQFVADGWEGVIVRNPNSLYKFGRSSTKSGEALKIKRFKDGEAVVLDVYERMHNANEATTNALGRTERSSHKANKIGRGDLGGFTVEELINGQRTGRVFKIGTGFNDEQRSAWWYRLDVDNENGPYDSPECASGNCDWTPEVQVHTCTHPLIGQIVKYKHFEVGSKDLPRFPVFLGFRDERDM